jgi:Ankyrin repeats (many copies)
LAGIYKSPLRDPYLILSSLISTIVIISFISESEATWSADEPLFKAIVDNDISRAEECLKAASDSAGTGAGTGAGSDQATASKAVNMRDEEGKTPLHFAADRGLLDMTKLLISHGADLNAMDSEGQTPLMLATLCEHEVSGQSLLFFMSYS